MVAVMIDSGRAIERAMSQQDWQDAGAGWQGKDGELRLIGWGRQRRIVILRRRIERSLVVERNLAGQLSLGFAEIDGGRDSFGLTPHWFRLSRRLATRFHDPCSR